MFTEQLSNAITFAAFYTTSRVGTTGLVLASQLTVDVFNPAGSKIVSADNNIIDVGDGLYRYNLAGSHTGSAGEYEAVFHCTSSATDQKDQRDTWSVGRPWVQNMDQAVSSRSTLAAAGVWNYGTRNLTDFGFALTAPNTQATINPTGGGSMGGSLAAGTYYLTYTWTNPAGETTASPDSAQFTVSSGNIPQVTLPTFEVGASAANIYLTPANGSIGSEVLYATGITVTNPTLSAAAPGGAQPAPTINTTNALSTAIWTANSRTLSSFTFSVTVGTNNDKTGYGLAATGLDQIAVTDPGGISNITTLPKMMVSVYRYFYRKTSATTTQLQTYADDNATVRMTMTLANDGTTAIKSAAQ